MSKVETDLSKSILKNSRESWLVADASKWGRFAALREWRRETDLIVYTPITANYLRTKHTLIEDATHT